MSNVTLNGKPYDVSKVFLHVESSEAKAGEKTLAQLDTNGDKFISFEESGSDVAKFQELAGKNSVRPYKGLTLEEAKVKSTEDKKVVELAVKAYENGCNGSFKLCY